MIQVADNHGLAVLVDDAFEIGVQVCHDVAPSLFLSSASNCLRIWGVLQLDDFAGEVVQGVLLRDIQEADADGAESLRPGAGALVHLAVAVFDISQHRLAQVGQMRADLVGAARDQANPAQGKGPGGAQHVHIGDDLLAALILRLVGMDADLVVLFVVLPPGREPPALGDAHGDGVVFPF